MSMMPNSNVPVCITHFCSCTGSTVGVFAGGVMAGGEAAVAASGASDAARNEKMAYSITAEWDIDQLNSRRL